MHGAPAGYHVTVRKVLVAALLLPGLLVLSACRPAEPGQADWRATAEQAVADTVSEVATSRLTVRQSLDDSFVGRYPIVVLTYSEEAAGAAADSVSTLQPPPRARPNYDRLTSTLSDAGDAISRARIAVTAGDEAASREAVAELTGILGDLRRLEERLRAAR
jgi:hypothetical protein